MSERALRVERRGPVLEVTLDRPKANAIDAVTSRSMGETFAAFRDDPELRVAILTGAGERFFSAGWDLKAAAAGESLQSDYGLGGFGGLTELFDLHKPVIAAVNGAAVGGGFELALAADLMLAAEHAELWLPEANLGIVPDAGGVLRLPRRLPRPLAMEMLLTGRRMDAAEAARWGVVNAVVPGADLMARSQGLAARIAAAAPLSVAAVLETVRATEGLSVEAGYAHMASGALPAYQRVLRSEDAREGARAFAEKREPVWRGR